MEESNTPEEIRNVDPGKQNYAIQAFDLFCITGITNLLWFFILQPLFGFPLSIIFTISIGYGLFSLFKKKKE
ncbi:MAG: hypothetical protein ACXACA_09060 [Candidatus Ranarchaeia archaeon]|jgi:hypothetical protein